MLLFTPDEAPDHVRVTSLSDKVGLTEQEVGAPQEVVAGLYVIVSMGRKLSDAAAFEKYA